MITLLHNKKLLVGSRAIQYYADLNRPLKDWDIWSFDPTINNQIIKGNLVDYHQISPNEYELINTLQGENLPEVETPIGLALVTPLWFNFLLKASHYSVNKKAKHLQDFQILQKLNFEKPKKFDLLLLNRFQETQARQSDFFEEETPRYLPHDWVHLQVANALGHNLPAFISLVTNDNYIASGEDFAKLSFELKKRCVLEEAITLGLERWLIYNIANRSGSIVHRWEIFCSSHSPAIEWFERLGATGRIKRNPEYISNFVQNHYNELITELPIILCHLRTNMPSAWWNGLLGIRCETQKV